MTVKEPQTLYAIVSFRDEEERFIIHNSRGPRIYTSLAHAKSEAKKLGWGKYDDIEIVLYSNTGEAVNP